MGDYISTADHAARIRGTLKTKHTITSRQVSVRSDNYSLGSAIRITVNDPTVSAKLVEAIASPSEHIDRDQFGDILNGGNRYVDVSYTDAALEVIGQRYLAVVQAAAAELDAAGERPSCLIPVAGTPFLIGRPAQWATGYSLWDENSPGRQTINVEELARAVGVLMLERGVKRGPRVETTPTPTPALTLVPKAPAEVPHTYGCQAASRLGHACCCPPSLTPSA
jgi:hypothetical protein